MTGLLPWVRMLRFDDMVLASWVPECNCETGQSGNKILYEENKKIKSVRTDEDDLWNASPPLPLYIQFYTVNLRTSCTMVQYARLGVCKSTVL